MLKSKLFGFILLAMFAVSAQTVIYKYTKEQKASYASFAAYLTSVGTTKTSWEMGKDVAIAATTHIQSNIDIRSILSQAKFTGASNLYIGRMSAKSENQIFDTSLTVFFDTGSVSEVCVHWFGNSKAAFRRANNSAATNGLALSVAKYQYPIVGKVSVTSSVDITSFSKSAMLKGNTGSGTDTLVIARMSAKPEYQVFDTSLTVIFNKNSVAYVDRKWFGSDARFNTARDSVRICINTDKMIIDTLRGNTNIDSISGHPVIDSLKLGNSEDYLSEYIDTTFYDTLYDNTTYISRGIARIVKIGSLVTLYQPQLIGSLTTSTGKIGGIPSKFFPSSQLPNYVIRVLSNNLDSLGYAFLYSGQIRLLNSTGSGLSSSNESGIQPSILSWIK